MSRITKSFLLTALAVAVFILPAAGCRQDNGSIELKYDFSDNAEGWTGDFADLPVNYEQDSYQLGFGYTDSPLSGKALMISSMNRSDDTFMFIKKQLTSADGLSPNTAYLVTIEVTFASNAPAGAVGIGGPPGEAVYVKVGASAIEPSPVDDNGFYTLTVDKGSQSEGGRDAVVVGNVAKLVNDDFETYELKTLANQDNPLEVTTDADGNMWIFAGTDSGFEGLTTLYYTEVNITLEAK
ncbi:MAG: hypothetical protein WC877_07410 [Dehalococcoidales bacterium]|jgi:hypothetical protein